MAGADGPSTFSPHDRVITCGDDGEDDGQSLVKVPIHSNGHDKPATGDMEVGEECEVQTDDGGDMVEVLFTAQKWNKLKTWAKRQHVKHSGKGWTKVDAAAPAPEAPVAPRPISPLERFITPTMGRLQSIKPGDRPGTRDKLPTWLKRNGLCVVREDNVVPMHLLIPEMAKTMAPGPLRNHLQTLAGQPVEGGEIPAQMITESALRCVKRLKHQGGFLEWSLDRQDKWIKSQGYANFTIEPQALVAELERLGAVRAGPSPQRLTYDEVVLVAPTEVGAAPVLPKSAAAMCRVFTVNYLAANLKVGLSKDEMKKFKTWLRIMGCRLGPDPRGDPNTYQVSIMAGMARQSTTAAAAQELQSQVEKELPIILKYIFGDPSGPEDHRPLHLLAECSSQQKGFVIGKKGEDIQKLESQHGVRLAYIGCGFQGWASTSLLPYDAGGSAESLKGLGARLQNICKTAQPLISNHILGVMKRISEEDRQYLIRKEQRKRMQEKQMKDAASSPLQETGQFGAAQLDRDHTRETNARKKEQRKEHLLAREMRQHHWKKKRDNMEQQRGGRHKSGEGHVGREDRADAGQGASGVAEDLRAEWVDPVGEGFKSQLDEPSQKVPGSHPRHRGHQPGNMRQAFDAAKPAPKRKVVQRGYSAIYEGMTVDSSTEEDE